MNASPEVEEYFSNIQEELNRSFQIAEEARKKGFDPEDKVDIHLAKNMAERVEGLIAAVAPQIINSGVSERIQQLEQQYKPLAWEVALAIAAEVSEEKFCKFKDKKEAMEIGIRTGFAYHTVGIVSAPLEGFTGLRIKKRKDGKEYFAACFSGPVRGAGGTAAAFCLMIADYIRIRNGYSEYDPDENEANRYATELYDYHERVTNLQYKPSPEEIKYLIKNMPIEVDGDPTEDIEVSNYKDLPRVATDRIRGGVCLVVSMVALKAPKLYKELPKLKGFGLNWDFLQEFLAIQKAMKSGKKEKTTKLTPDYTFIADLVAGRPVLTYPLAKGGFRLRYGRTRMSGYSAAALSPLTMAITENYLAIGTQIKVERPGKAAALTPCDSIEGPIVKLKNGEVIRIESAIQAKQIYNEIEEILFLGDILISYGDFFDRAHPLVPAGYCEEWYAKELERATANFFGSMDYEKMAELTGASALELESLIKNPLNAAISAEKAIIISEKLNIPLHPRHTHHWNSINLEELKELAEWLSKATVSHEDNRLRIIAPVSKEKRSLELIGMQHSLATNSFVVIENEEAAIVKRLLIRKPLLEITEIIENAENVLEAITKISGITIRDKSGTFIGARMGRPEKAKMRKLTGSPHCLFPVGDEGGRLRSAQSAAEKGKVTAAFPVMFCENCKQSTIYRVCENCETRTMQNYYCKLCGQTEKEECIHGKAQNSKEMEIDISKYLEAALKKIKTKSMPNLVKGVRGTSSKNHIPENLAKGMLRAKYNIAVNKDGTTRYDMTEVPITHFRPKEILTPIQKLIELGYNEDIYGNKIEDEEQILELLPQDIILPSSQESLDESSDDVLFRVSKFIDELLANLYGGKPFYNLKSKKDLVGHLVIGLAPHISAGMVGRIIGFSKTQCFLAHPLFHAAMRRDADGDEACVMMLMDAFLNFSRQFLPDTRGGRTMDAPLVLTARLVPAEVDDMVHKLDICWEYPLELYEASLSYKMPEEVKLEMLGARINTPAQYQKIGFTHSISNINAGVLCSAYKTLPSMEEKLKGQMLLAERIRAVDTQDVARLVIEKHFIKDIKGNLRKFSTQQFRCVNCNKKFRRPPLIGKCDACNGRIIFTVSEGSVVKYMGLATALASKYKVSAYVQQTLMLTKRRIEDVFGKESEKQAGLEGWITS